jgi:hypothetical protein
MLRINVDTITGSLNYGIPPTNPYAGQEFKKFGQKESEILGNFRSID